MLRALCVRFSWVWQAESFPPGRLCSRSDRSLPSLWHLQHQKTKTKVEVKEIKLVTQKREREREIATMKAQKDIRPRVTVSPSLADVRTIPSTPSNSRSQSRTRRWGLHRGAGHLLKLKMVQGISQKVTRSSTMVMKWSSQMVTRSKNGQRFHGDGQVMQGLLPCSTSRISFRNEFVASIRKKGMLQEFSMIP